MTLSKAANIQFYWAESVPPSGKGISRHPISDAGRVRWGKEAPFGTNS